MAKGIPHKRNNKAILTLAGNIKKYRKQKELTINELALEVGVDYSQIARMERAVVNPNISIIFDIANALGIEPYLLLLQVETDEEIIALKKK